ncbi:MAG: hypothetical protein JWQ38_3496 [Flavipsychrobacter sp.]|nr:hypothetical protein [Flavipsychrobacter sp.]
MNRFGFYNFFCNFTLEINLHNITNMEKARKEAITVIKKSWSDPKITVLSINENTLGSTNPGDDGGPAGTLS